MSGLLVVFGVMKVLIEFFKWFRTRHDWRVLEVLESNAHIVSAGLAGRRKLSTPMEVSAISEKTGMSENKVLGCLQRLRKTRAVQKFGEAWKVPEA